MTTALLLVAALGQLKPGWVESVVLKPVGAVAQVLGDGEFKGRVGYFDQFTSQLGGSVDRAANYKVPMYKLLRVGYDTVNADDGDRVVFITVQYLPERAPADWKQALKDLGIESKSVDTKDFHPTDTPGNVVTVIRHLPGKLKYFMANCPLQPGYKGITFVHKNYLSDPARAWFDGQ